MNRLRRVRETGEGGFTLMEALVALTIFAIGTLMIVPTMFTWVRANSVSLQRDEAVRILQSQVAHLSQMSVDQAPWTDISNTASNYSQARDLLDGMSESALTDLGTASGFSTPVSTPSVGMTASVSYGVVGIVDAGGNTLSQVMRLRITWDGPAGSQLAEERLVER
ncbi:type IV pilus modification PilV family protein [Thiohalorhabdus sp. Cl-TMA]|uniref:Prepilin-type N-terminal cleavage/methylation domain-containing protein n=1 Tax=Thiohalorhabdus methylotrophus TaxID=3242694 RepID=A0ABV4TWZ0_9GAMM